MAKREDTTYFEKKLLEFVGTKDPMLEMLQWVMDKFMEIEVSQKTGAEKGERTEKRTGYRSGYRIRRFDTRLGTVYLSVPKIRQGGYIPFFVTEKKRSEQALIQVVQECWLNGVSTCKIEKIAGKLGLESLSASEVSEINKGLANSIIEGVTKTVSKYGRVIVLEDDLETSPSFLTYMNKALDYYSPFQSVFSISSDIPMKMPVIKEYDFDVFVSHRNFSYGWGTWCDRWQQVDWSMGAFNMLEKDVFMQQAFNRGGSDLYNMLQAQKQHKIDSWSIRFTLAHFVLHAVSIMPTQSFIRHLGLDGSGTHCPSTQMISERKLNMKTDFHFLPVIYEDKRFIDAFYMCYVRKKLPLIKRLINKMLKVSGFK